MFIGRALQGVNVGQVGLFQFKCTLTGERMNTFWNYGLIAWNDYTLSEGSIVNYFESGHLSTMDFDGSKQPVARQNQGEE